MTIRDEQRDEVVVCDRCETKIRLPPAEVPYRKPRPVGSYIVLASLLLCIVIVSYFGIRLYKSRTNPEARLQQIAEWYSSSEDIIAKLKTKGVVLKSEPMPKGWHECRAFRLTVKLSDSKLRLVDLLDDETQEEASRRETLWKVRNKPEIDKMKEDATERYTKTKSRLNDAPAKNAKAIEKLDSDYKGYVKTLEDQIYNAEHRRFGRWTFIDQPMLDGSPVDSPLDLLIQQLK